VRGGSIESTNDHLPYAAAVAVVAVGTILDSVSTVVGNSYIAGVEEWNVVILAVAGVLPFPVAVFAIKAAALGFVTICAVVLWRMEGPWKVCLVVPGVVWTTVGVLNVVTIASSM
jgi:hypothetical protein